MFSWPCENRSWPKSAASWPSSRRERDFRQHQRRRCPGWGKRRWSWAAGSPNERRARLRPRPRRREGARGGQEETRPRRRSRRWWCGRRSSWASPPGVPLQRRRQIDHDWDFENAATKIVNIEEERSFQNKRRPSLHAQGSEKMEEKKNLKNRIIKFTRHKTVDATDYRHDYPGQVHYPASGAQTISFFFGPVITKSNVCL